MAEYHFPVPGGPGEETIEVFVHRHWASFIGQFFLSIILLILPIGILLLIYFMNKNFFSGNIAHFLVIGISIYYLVIIDFIFISWISFYNDIYIICTDTIIDITQEGFFGRNISQLSMLRVQDVSSSIKGIFATLFGYGDVLVETAGEQSEHFVIKSVPNPQEISSKILELHNKIIETEGRHQQLSEAEGVLAGGPSDKVLPAEPNKQQPEQPQEMPKEPTTEYQELLKKDQEEIKKGEVSKEDLEKGGEIDLK